MNVAIAGGLAFVTVWLAWGPVTARQRVVATPPVVRRPGRTPVSWSTAWAVAAIVGLGLWFVSGVWWLGLLAIPVPWAMQRWLPHQDEDRDRALMSGAPEALALIDACVRAGLPLRRATNVVGQALTGPVSEWLCGVDAAISVGSDEATAWQERRHDPVLGRAARDVARCVDSGAALSTVLGRHCDELRSQVRADVLERARSVGVKSVLPLMLCFLPAFVALGVVPIIASVAGKILG